MPVKITWKLDSKKLSKILKVFERNRGIVQNVRFIQLNNGLVIEKIPLLNWEKASYAPWKKTIQIPYINSKEDLVALLYEFGHFVCNHTLQTFDYKYFYGTVECAKEEIDAWNYAIMCIKDEYVHLFFNLIFDCLEHRLENPFLTKEKYKKIKKLIQNYKKKLRKNYGIV